MSYINPLFRWWVTPRLPINHIYLTNEERHVGINKLMGTYIKRFFIHPIKRRLAKYYLITLKKIFGLKVIAITGSAGKTTTKEMIASILKQDGGTIASLANIDPIYNIPSTILRCTPFTKYLVLEMGIEYPGEMDFYLWLATPDMGVITNIYPTHTEFLGDVGGVYMEKSKLVRSLKKNDIAVLNSQDKYLTKLKNSLTGKIVWFGDGTAVMASQEKLQKNFTTEFRIIFDQNSLKKIKVTIPVFGSQFILNALAASAASYSLGISIQKIKYGLEVFEPQKHRMRVKELRGGALLIDDSYNNNPEAAKVSLQALSFFPGRGKIVIFGDMLELGNWNGKYHEELGKFMGKLHLSKLICVGESAKISGEEAVKVMGKANVFEVSGWEEALSKLRPFINKNSLVFVKGSRGIGLDRLVSRLS